MKTKSIVLMLLGVLFYLQPISAQNVTVLYDSFWGNVTLTFYSDNNTMEFTFSPGDITTTGSKVITVYSGNPKQMQAFFQKITQFVKSSKNKAGSGIIIDNRVITIVKGLAGKYINIRVGGQNVPVTNKEIKKALEAVIKYNDSKK